jgi:hypothetical protein
VVVEEHSPTVFDDCVVKRAAAGEVQAIRLRACGGGIIETVSRESEDTPIGQVGDVPVLDIACKC